MQQLAGLFPGSYYNSDESKALDFMGYFAHQRQQDEAFQNQAINREGALEDLFQTRQMNPLRVNNQRLMNDTLEAQLGGHRARSKEAELKLDTDTQLQPHLIKQKIAEAFKGVSAAELDQNKNLIRQALLNPKLSDQERKVYSMLRDQFDEFYKLNQTLESKEKIAATPKPGRTGSGGPKAPAPPKAPKDDIQLSSYWQFQADQENDPTTKTELQALADGARSRALALIQAKADAAATGKVDLGAIGGVPTRQGITPTTGQPPAAPKPAAAPKAPTGRVVIYKDGKAVGTIPESQRDAAVKQGYLVK